MNFACSKRDKFAETQYTCKYGQDKKQTNSDLNKKQKKNGQMISGFLEPQTCYKVCMCNPLEHDRH